jgi:N-formylglutamate deformylase
MPLGQTLRDTDWHVDRLYDGLLEGVTTVRANFHRYVIDANRDPSGAASIPARTRPGWCRSPTSMVNHYGWSEPETPAEIEARRPAWHAPYHAALEAELERVRSHPRRAVLYDCHSIRSVIPWLFEGVLPDFNIGTNNGETCAPVIEAVVAGICAGAEGYSSVLNGRFKGGWTTRHYGRPGENMHAIQMELAQSPHLATEELPFAYDEAKAERLRVHLKTILNSVADLAASLGGQS